MYLYYFKKHKILFFGFFNFVMHVHLKKNLVQFLKTAGLLWFVKQSIVQWNLYIFSAS